MFSGHHGPESRPARRVPWLCRPWQLGDGSGPGQICLLLGRSGSASPFTRGFLRRHLSLSGSGAAFGQNTELGRASGADVGGLGRCVFEALPRVGWPRAGSLGEGEAALCSCQQFEQLGAESKRMSAGTVAGNQGRWSWETCFGHRERTPEPSPVHPSSGLPQRGGRLAMSLSGHRGPPWPVGGHSE